MKSFKESQKLQALLYKKANIWLTTLVVLVVILALAIPQLKPSPASASAKLSFFARIRKAFSPTQAPTPTDNTPTNPQNPNTQDSANAASLNNPLIFNQQDQGPSAPQLVIGLRLNGVSSGLQWAEVGKPISGEYGGISAGKDFAALNEQWKQYDAGGGGAVIGLGGSAARPSDNLPGLEITVNWGDRTTSILRPAYDRSGWDGNIFAKSILETNGDAYVPNHAYDSPGLYTITTKACYKTGRPLPTDPNIIIRNPDGFNLRSSLDGRCSQEARYSMRVVDGSLCAIDPTIKYQNLGCSLAGPDLLIKMEKHLLPDPVRKISEKTLVYKPETKLRSLNSSLINVGSSTATISQVMINDQSPLTLQTTEELWVNSGGTDDASEIGHQVLRIFPKPPTVANGYDLSTDELERLRFHALILTSPLVIAPGQTVNLSAAAMYRKFVCVPGKDPTGNLVPHNIGFVSFGMPNQTIWDPASRLIKNTIVNNGTSNWNIVPENNLEKTGLAQTRYGKDIAIDSCL